jgi:hypothetical protein
LNVVVADELRDGNAPALKDPLRCAQRAYAAVPVTVQERYFRGDSACGEEGLLSWLRDEKRAGGVEPVLELEAGDGSVGIARTHAGKEDGNGLTDGLPRALSAEVNRKTSRLAKPALPAAAALPGNS